MRGTQSLGEDGSGARIQCIASQRLKYKTILYKAML